MKIRVFTHDGMPCISYNALIRKSAVEGERPMVKVEHSVVIDRPLDEVFGYVSDLTHSADWQNGLLEVRKLTKGPLGVGTKFAFVREFLGRRLESANEFVAFEPNALVKFVIPDGPVPGEASYEFKSTTDGTKVTSKLELSTQGFSRLAEPLVTPSLKKDVKANLTRLKELLEGDTVASMQKS
jgi:uncharacterized membrane protein